MKVLVACEVSGRVRDAFRDRGHDAYSCDILPNDSEFHYQCDVLDILNDGWDLMIAHPPCTYLTCAAEWAYGEGPYHQKVKPGTLVGEPRRKARQAAIGFVKNLMEAPIPKICIENPVGVLSKEIAPPHSVYTAIRIWRQRLQENLFVVERAYAPYSDRIMPAEIGTEWQKLCFQMGKPDR